MIKAICFYLPQFHPIPENDEWWGKGFTEWRNVVRARPLFPGHYQPHLPADLGFYDLRLPEVREAQAELARQYGIYGFCYYHYWFNGRRILERPFQEVLESGKPDFPFCLCWANENWTRTWDGGEKEILLKQHYDHEDDRNHIRSLLPAFSDPRYIRINGKPLFLVYRTELLPDPKVTAEIWREECDRAGIGEIYLARVENFCSGIDPKSIGFDTAVEFAPDGINMGKPIFGSPFAQFMSRIGILPRAYYLHKVVRYSALAEGMSNRSWPSYKWHRCVTPMWDNTPRRMKKGRIVIDSSPELYKNWLKKICNQTIAAHSNKEERIVFINAWNEWAEGAHLEPDLKWGHAYLEATLQALKEIEATPKLGASFLPNYSQNNASSKANPVHSLKKVYWNTTKYPKMAKEVLYNILRISC